MQPGKKLPLQNKKKCPEIIEDTCLSYSGTPCLQKNPGSSFSGNKKDAGKISLYCVPTPIGNYEDMTFRSVDVLRKVDFIAAENPEKSKRLLDHFGIDKPVYSYFEHNKSEKGRMIAGLLSGGQTCALITDAGTPAIADPGEELVRQCHELGLSVSALPGACAAVSALAMSGLATSRFCFEGFLSTAKNSRRERLQFIRDDKRTIIFYEASHKLSGLLADMKKYLGNRKISLISEISKPYEKVFITDIDGALSHYSSEAPKGEFVIIVEGAGKEKNQISDDMIDKKFTDMVFLGYSPKDAAKELSKEYSIPKRLIFERFSSLFSFDNKN